MNYVPRVPPQTPEDLLPYLDDELGRVAEVLNRTSYGEFEILYNPPRRLFPGLVVYADGTSWDPGSGEGLYRRSLANTWVYIG